MLSKIINIHSPSGNEDKLKDYILSSITNKNAETFFDNFGNLIVRLSGGEKKVMISVSIDEGGFVVLSKDNDKAYLAPLGNKKTFTNTLVEFKNGTHALLECENIEKPCEKLFARIFSNNINVGDTAVNYTPFIEEDNYFYGKNIASYLTIEAFVSVINEIKPLSDLYFVFAVQGKLLGRGLKTSLYNINPDILIHFDSVLADESDKEKNGLVFPLSLLFYLFLFCFYTI